MDIHGSVEGLYRRDIGFVEWKRKELHRYFGGFMCIYRDCRGEDGDF